MKIQDLLQLYAASAEVAALAGAIGKKSVKTLFLEGLVASAVPVMFASVAGKKSLK